MKHFRRIVEALFYESDGTLNPNAPIVLVVVGGLMIMGPACYGEPIATAMFWALAAISFALIRVGDQVRQACKISAKVERILEALDQDDDFEDDANWPEPGTGVVSEVPQGKHHD